MRNPSDLYGCPVCGQALESDPDHPYFFCSPCRRRWNWADLIGQPQQPMVAVKTTLLTTLPWVVKGVRVGKFGSVGSGR